MADKVIVLFLCMVGSANNERFGVLSEAYIGGVGVNGANDQTAKVKGGE